MCSISGSSLELARSPRISCFGPRKRRPTASSGAAGSGRSRGTSSNRTVFAAEVADQAEPRLTWEHSEFGWFTTAERRERLTLRGLLEGLGWTRRYVSERDEPDAM